MNRRSFLAALAAGTLASLTACSRTGAVTAETALPDLSPSPERTPSPARTPTPTSTLTPPHSPSPAPRPTHTQAKTRRPALSSATGKAAPDPVIWGLPGKGQQVAWTVDDGTDSEVVSAYCDFVKASGIRLTFFVAAINRSWTEQAHKLRPLVESGQVQLGNHTWSHPNLKSLSDSGIAREINRADKFISNTFGVSARPFLRPPYGYHNARTDRIAAEEGYHVITMWYGSFGDSSVLTPAQVLANARKWMTAQRIVLAHADHPAVTHVYPQLLELIHQRRLQTVTLDDVFTSQSRS